MGADDGGTGTVVAVMSAPKLDRRTIAICASIALVGAIAAALVATVVLDDDPAKPSGDLELIGAGDVDTDALLAIELTEPDGGATTLGELQHDQPMLINLWQSSCVPCVDEMPLLDAAQAGHRDVSFVGVASQDQPDKAAALAEQTAITYPWLLDPNGDTYYAANAAGMPSTVLVDEDGTLLATETGAFADAAELESFIDEHLGDR